MLPGKNKFAAASVLGLIYLGRCSHITFAAFAWQSITYGHQEMGGCMVGCLGRHATVYAVQ